MDSRVIVPAPAAAGRRRPPPPPASGPVRPGSPEPPRLRPAPPSAPAAARPPPVPAPAAPPRTPLLSAPRRCRRRQPQPLRPSDNAGQPSALDARDRQAARPMGGAGGRRGRRGGGTSGSVAGAGPRRQWVGPRQRSAARWVAPTWEGAAPPGAGRGRPGLWECGGLGRLVRLSSAPLGPARVHSAWRGRERLAARSCARLWPSFTVWSCLRIYPWKKPTVYSARFRPGTDQAIVQCLTYTR